MGTRSRTLKYLPGHELRFGIAAVSRDEASGDVVEAVCLFCKHFGREQRADKKRKSASTVKYFRDSFRPDQYTQHHHLQHPTQWKHYKASSDDDKRQFFPRDSTESTITTSSSNSTMEVVLIPKTEERGRCFDLKAAIVEVVAVLAVGFSPVESTVTTRDHLMYQYMTHHHYEEKKINCPLWSPPPDTFERLYLVQKQPPIYRVVLFSKDQIDFLMEMAAEGLSGAQISIALKTFRHHASVLLRDLVENSEKNGPMSKKNVAMAVERAENHAREIFRVEDVSPEYNEAQTAEFVRLGVAVSLSIIARLLDESWFFSLELCTVAQHSMYSYLDVRVKFYNRIGGLRSAHLLAIPKYVGKCDTMMFQTLNRVLGTLLPEWRKKLLGITTDGDIPIPRRLVDVVKHFQNAASGSALYRTSSCINQLRHILNTFYASIENGRFLKTMKELSEYVRNEVTVLSDMKRFPGYGEQLDSDAHSPTSAPTAFGREVDMLVIHYALVEGHFKGIALPAGVPSVISASWWLTLQVLHWVTARANAVFEVLEKQYVTIFQQATVMTSLAEEFITGFHAQIHECKLSVPQPNSSEYLSLDKRVALSKASMVDFVVSSSEHARDLMKHARANAVFEVLEKQYVTISQQATVMTSLAEEFITGFHAQIHECKRSVPQPNSSEYLSLDKRVALSKASMVDFVVSSSEHARDLMKHGGMATVKAASEYFAPGAVNMIASLLELSTSLKQQHAACEFDPSTHASETTVMTDLLPPVMPHELAHLSSEELDELLEAHDAASRGPLNDDDVKAIYEEHDLLRRAFAEDDDLRSALEMCTQGTPFDVAWSLMDTRFTRLEAFAGGLATVCPSNAVTLSDRNVRDLVVCPKDMEEARLLLADFELESALHAQQFQSLTKLQEEIYDREISESRTQKRQKVSSHPN
ncbi:Hypothetical protein PHPALM_6660 [Phytophthora palmivora]|uniref:Uncharacterized protein n=1 Tax=Phytophthora palmivora TaxID=4796 RepID=A0A2P4YEB2_9STRA|nr:Hypothetical protein PHPALM_6660 [Phytophthora palmivora]